MDGTSPQPSTSPAFTCSRCERQFLRAEHLKRHILTHTSERHFSCAWCKKAFVRRDALQRHERIHQAAEPSLLSRGIRACINCASAKSRCSGDTECDRCRKRSLSCTYPKSVPNEDDGHTPGSPNTALSSTDVTLAHANLAPSLTRASKSAVVSGKTQAIDPPVYESIPISQISSHPSVASVFPSTDMAYWNPASPSNTDWFAFQGGLPDFSASSAESRHGNGREYQAPDLVQEDRQRWINWISPPAHPQSFETFGNYMPPLEFFLADESAIISTECSESPATTGEKPAEPGEYYVDGEAARLPRVKRRKLSSLPATQPFAETLFDYSMEPPLELVQTIPEHEILDQVAYEDLSTAYHRHCLECADSLRPFSAATLPSSGAWWYLVDLCLKNFELILPMIHRHTIISSAQHWLFVLILSELGSHFLEGGNTLTFVVSIQEFARRVISSPEGEKILSDLDPFVKAQILTLHMVAFTYSGNEEAVTLTTSLQHELARYATKEVGEPHPFSSESGLSLYAEWQTWCKREARIRTRAAIWILDCMWKFHFQCRPKLSLDDATYFLPCHEELWSASTAEEWKRLFSKYTATPTLQEALQGMYTSKSLPAEIGEFSRVLLIHGLFHRTWEVEAYFGKSLSHWVPTAATSPAENVLPKSPVWLPSVPIYTKWRNSACDCLDALHWDANAKIGLASGLEHPTVLHLHLARVILLSPITAIVRLAQALTGSVQHSPIVMQENWKIVQKWATADQFKARLAMIHAGVLFFHIRRHSTNAFYEPPSVALATLALWAFGAFSPPRQQSLGGEDSTDEQYAQPSSVESENDEDVCNVILLDRPTDDELVQNFVRRGDKMHVYLSGVGDLHGPQGDERVLVQGCKLLRSLRCWSGSQYSAQLLEHLSATWKREKKKLQNPGVAS